MNTIFTRNFRYALRHPLRTWAVRKACRDHVRRYPMCEWCGSVVGVQAHHVVPLWEDESLGADSNNFISLCMTRKCHFVVGHAGNFARRYVANVKALCTSRKLHVRPKAL